jgi:hypothetical protein
VLTVERAPVTEAAGMPLRILRSEGLVLFAVAVAAFFSQLDEAWWLLPALLFLPDLFMAGYVQSTRLGAATYNVAHSYPVPAIVGVVAVASSSSLWEAVALIWFAHIGMDRALAYGLKYDDSFTHTHLGWIK